MILYIVRHGDPDYAHDSLTEKGFEQAERLSMRMARKNIDDFYVSPLGRAKRTVEPTLRRVNKEAKVLDWIREFPANVNNEPFRGELGEEPKSLCPWDIPDWYWKRFPESFSPTEWQKVPVFRDSKVPQVYESTKESLWELLGTYGLQSDGNLFRAAPSYDPEKRIAFFCHQGMGLALVSILTCTPLPVAFMNYFLSPSSVTKVEFRPTRGRTDLISAKVMYLGDLSHLSVTKD